MKKLKKTKTKKKKKRKRKKKNLHVQMLPYHSKDLSTYLIVNVYF